MKLWPKVTLLAFVLLGLNFGCSDGSPPRVLPQEPDGEPVIQGPEENPSSIERGPVAPNPPLQSPSPKVYHTVVFTNPACRIKAIEDAYNALANAEPVALDASLVHQWHGIKNLGNTCFINAALKLLARRREVFNLLRDQNEKELNAKLNDEQEKNLRRVRRAARVQISSLRLGNNSPAKKIPGLGDCSIEELHDAMKSVDALKRFTTHSQMDSDEFIVDFASELSLDRESPHNKMVFFGATEDSSQSLSNGRFEDLNIFNALWLKFGEDAKDETTLHDLLNDFTAHEILKEPRLYNNYALNYKKIYLAGVDRSTLLWVAPSFDGRVLRRTIVRPFDKIVLSYLNPLPKLNVIIPSITKLADISQAKAEMQLAAIIIHVGGLKSGHYFVYLKDENQGYFEHNDAAVRRLRAQGQGIGDIEEKNSNGEVTKKALVYLYER